MVVRLHSLDNSIQVLAFINLYLPGYKGGGPARSLCNMVASLNTSIKFKIFTTDRDMGDKVPYPEVCTNTWTPLRSSEVFYASSGYRLVQKMWHVLKNESYDVVYLNSFFHPIFSILPLCITQWFLRSDVKVILAPRGEFSPGALSIKKNKKKAYLLIAKFLRLTKGLTWHASSKYEAEDIRREFGTKTDICIAANIPDVAGRAPYRLRQHDGVLKLIFLSRISPKKNLSGALDTLAKIAENVEFNIYGPIDDALYWEKCCKKMDQLPSNVKVSYLGAINPLEVSSVFAQHDLFLFPTHGENYGHVIIESLSAGCPVLISDQTPWLDLEEQGVGWSLPLSEQTRFVEIIEWMATQNYQKLNQYAERSRLYAEAHSGSVDVIESNLALFKGVEL